MPMSCTDEDHQDQKGHEGEEKTGTLKLSINKESLYIRMTMLILRWQDEPRGVKEECRTCSKKGSSA